MIENKHAAIKINEKILKISEILNEIILIAEEECQHEEFLNLRNATGKVLGEILFEILNPLYKDHPDIKPSGFND